MLSPLAFLLPVKIAQGNKLKLNLSFKPAKGKKLDTTPPHCLRIMATVISSFNTEKNKQQPVTSWAATTTQPKSDRQFCNHHIQQWYTCMPCAISDSCKQMKYSMRNLQAL